MMDKKKIVKLNLKQVKEFLLKKNLVIKKNRKTLFSNDFKSFYYTAISSFIIIIFFYALPTFIELKDSNIIVKKEIENKSKTNLEKVLKGEPLKKTSNVDEGLDLKNLFEDVFAVDDLPSDTVRLNAATIEQLFKDTNYSLENVRKTKIVKPIALSLLPEEMKMIVNTKKRKNLFIQIILPLILEENNRIKLDRKKLFSILNKNNNSDLEKRWLNKKFKQYGVLNKDLSTLKIRMDYVPVSLAIAQAAKETGWGTSRFALEGNALFGQWTWSKKGISPKNKDPDKSHKILQFQILKASVRAYKNNLNTHNAYKEFREVRAKLRQEGEKINGLKLTKYLERYASIGQKYVEILEQIIKRNSLTDFDDANLLPTKLKKGIAL